MLIDLRERKKEGERGRETSLSHLSCAPQTRTEPTTKASLLAMGLIPSQGTCSLWDDAPTNWATPVRARLHFLERIPQRWHTLLSESYQCTKLCPYVSLPGMLTLITWLRGWLLGFCTVMIFFHFILINRGDTLRLCKCAVSPQILI